MSKRLAAICALTLVAVVPGLDGDRPAAADTANPPLTLTVGGGMVSDPTSPDGRALKQHSNSTASGDKPVTGHGARLVVRARGDQCQGAPRMRVLVDGEVVLETSVDAEQWTDYVSSAPVPPAAGRLEVEFVNDLLLPTCDRNLYTALISYRSAEESPERRASDVLFDADVEHHGLSAYAHVIHGERISIVDDPVLGGQRKVMKFTVEDGDTGPTANPRAQVETPKTFRDGDELWIGWSTLFPSSWPDRLPAGGQSWLTLSELYGPPYSGAAPVKLGMRSGARALTWQRNDSYGWDIPWERGPLLENRWYDQVLHVRLSHDAGTGFVEYFLNTGDGWQQQQLAGTSRLRMATLDGSNGDGPNYHKLALYRLRGMFPVLTVYHAEHRVGRTFDAVAPASYS